MIGPFAPILNALSLKRSSNNLRLAILFLLLATSAALAEDRKPTSLEQQGRALAERMCSACHAVGRRGKSRTWGRLPSARSTGGWSLIRSPIGCAKG